LNDLAGNYAAAQASVAIGGGQSELLMRKGKGMTIIVLANDGKESGTRLTLGPPVSLSSSNKGLRPKISDRKA
jgi:hypothetical protein